MSRDRRKRLWLSLIPHAILVVVCLVMLFPFYWSIVMASGTMSDFYTSPPRLIPGPHLWEHIRFVVTDFDIGFLPGMVNTLIVAISVTFLVLLLDSLAAFAFAKYTFPGKKWLFGLLILFFMLPGQLGLIPQFVIMGELGWIGSLKALIIPAAASAFGIFWLRQYVLASVPTELLEAATIDGCGFFRQWWHISLPIMRPGLAFLGIYTFIGQWNDYVWPLIVMNDPDKPTLQLALAQLNMGKATDYSLVMTGALLSTLPLIIVFALSAKQFIADIVAGAVK